MRIARFSSPASTVFMHDEVLTMKKQNPAVCQEEGIDVPYEQLKPDTLRTMIEEFVSREWSDWCDSGCSLEDKVEQVLRQLKEKKAKVVFDFASNTANIVVCR